MPQTTILIFILLAINLIIVIWAMWLQMRLNRVFGGKRAKELEHVLTDIQTDLSNIKDTHSEIKKRLVLSEKRLKHSIRDVETIRFNPFVDQGSNQSFATALVDDNGNGVVLSSLYSRERVSIFAKPIKNGVSEYELTEEEKSVLNKTYTHE